MGDRSGTGLEDTVGMTYLTYHLRPLINEQDTMLDVCCGECNPTRELPAKIKIGVDLDLTRLAKIGKTHIPIVYNVAEIGSLFIPRSFDVVMWLDGIEHLEQAAALYALEALEGIAKKRIVIFTPNEKMNFEMTLPELQRHKSFWPVKFWEDRGYKVDARFHTKKTNMLLAVRDVL